MLKWVSLTEVGCLLLVLPPTQRHATWYVVLIQINMMHTVHVNSKTMKTNRWVTLSVVRFHHSITKQYFKALLFLKKTFVLQLQAEKNYNYFKIIPHIISYPLGYRSVFSPSSHICYKLNLHSPVPPRCAVPSRSSSRRGGLSALWVTEGRVKSPGGPLGWSVSSGQCLSGCLLCLRSEPRPLI